MLIVPLLFLLGVAVILGAGSGSTRIPRRIVVRAILGQREDFGMSPVEAGTMALSYDRAVLIVR